MSVHTDHDMKFSMVCPRVCLVRRGGAGWGEALCSLFSMLAFYYLLELV